MVNMYVGSDERADVVDGEINGEVGGRGVPALILALEQAAVDEDAVVGALRSGGGTQVGVR
ncbi:hypothetical protein GCM10009113_07780 [Marinobacter szutsaonensis]